MEQYRKSNRTRTMTPLRAFCMSVVATFCVLVVGYETAFAEPAPFASAFHA